MFVLISGAYDFIGYSLKMWGALKMPIGKVQYAFTT